MNVIEHRVPFYPDGGFGLEDMPKTSNPRMKPLVDNLTAVGLIDADGHTLIPCKLMRGMDAHGWIFRVEWQDAAVPQPTTP